MKDFSEILKLLLSKKSLSLDESYQAASMIMDGTVSQTRTAALLFGLNMSGITDEEITGFALAMREKSLKIRPSVTPLVDTCGTGGDMSDSFNVSTVSAFIAAGAGCHVVKHGNRSVSSSCGSADVLEKLHVRIDLSPDKITECVESGNIGFLFAQAFHPAMKHVAPVRKELGMRTIFNVLGPLTNPAGADRQVLGVFDRSLSEKICRVLLSLGSVHALVVHGNDGFDEISLTDFTHICELKNGEISSYTVKPEDYGLKRCSLSDLKGGLPDKNAEIALKILQGEHGPQRDICLLNAAAALYVSGICDSICSGISLCEKSIDSGSALERLRFLQDFS